jgi:hypothetical protein
MGRRCWDRRQSSLQPVSACTRSASVEGDRTMDACESSARTGKTTPRTRAEMRTLRIRIFMR